jgi:hypothetical protein
MQLQQMPLISFSPQISASGHKILAAPEDDELGVVVVAANDGMPGSVNAHNNPAEKQDAILRILKAGIR